MFKVKNVTKKYGDDFALNQINLEISEGMNFIVGSSGSGKTSLLKIMSGMDSDYEGVVTFCNKDMKSFSSIEKSNLYNQTIGFIWQDFQLLEDATVEENVLLPTNINDTKRKSKYKSILKSVKLDAFKDQKINSLSGGQKQRVAIARELMKDPEVIFCDEPTSALDGKSVKTTMEILRKLAKNKVIIMVTHDTSLIKKNDTVLELDKGELIKEENVCESKDKNYTPLIKSKLTISSAIKVALMNLKNKMNMSLVSLISIVVSTILILSAIGGVVGNSGKNEFDTLVDTYGETLLDLQIISSFSNSSGTDGENNSASGSVDQDLSGLYEKYAKDSRTEFIIPTLAFDNIEIAMNDKKYNIESSGSAPQLVKLKSGKLPSNNEIEVVVPEVFVKSSGESIESILGQSIQFNAEIVKWNGSTPTYNKIGLTAKVSGVGDNTQVTEFDGEKFEYSIDDSFFFGEKGIQEIRKQGKTEDTQMNFIIRAKSIEDMISIKEELNKSGIVPLGAFELVDDILSLNTQTQNQSETSNIVLILLALVLSSAIALMSAILRKKEYAIYKVSGFTSNQLSIILAIEYIIVSILSVLLLLVSSPLINMICQSLFNSKIITTSNIYYIPLITLFFAIIEIIVSLPIHYRVSVEYLIKGETKHD